MAVGRDFLGLCIGIGLVIEQHGSGVSAFALLGAGRIGGHFVGDLGGLDFDMRFVVRAGEGRSRALQSGPAPNGLTIGMAGRGDRSAVLDSVAVLAVDGLAAVGGAGGFLIDGEVVLPSMASGIHIHHLGVLANLAGTNLHALVLALRCNDGLPFAVVMAVGGNRRDILLRIALLAMDGLAALNGAGRSLIDGEVLVPIMAGGIDLANLGMLADLADTALDALLLALRLNDGYPFGIIMAVGGDCRAAADLLAADGAVGIAGVAFERAGRIMCVADLGVLMELSGQRLGEINLLVVQLCLMDGNHRSDLDLGRVNAEGQGRNDRTGSDAIQIDIAEGDLAGLVLVGGVVGIHGHIGQGEQVGVIFDGSKAVGGRLVALGDDVDGNGLFIGGDGHVGDLGLVGNRSVEREQCLRLRRRSDVQRAGCGGILRIELGSNLVGRNNGCGLSCFSAFKARLDLCRNGSRTGSARISSVVYDLINRSRPDRRTEVTNLCGIPEVGLLTGILNNGVCQAVNLVGFAIKVRDVNDVAAIFLGINQRSHGSVIFTEAGIGQLRKRGIFRIADGIQGDTAIHIDISKRPDMAGIVKGKEPISRISRTSDVHIVGAVVRNRGEVVCTDVCKIILEGISSVLNAGDGLQSREKISIDPVHIRGILGGIESTVCNVEQGDVSAGTGNAGVACEVLTGLTVNGVEVVFRIEHDDLIVLRIQSGSGRALVATIGEISIALPSGILVIIPAIKQAMPLGILQGTVERDIQKLNRNCATCALGIVLDRGRGDDGLALADSSDDTVLVDGRNGLVAGRPRHSVGLHAERADLSLKRSGLTLVERQSFIADRDRDVFLQLILVQVDLESAVVVSVVIDTEHQMRNIVDAVCVQCKCNLVAKLCILGRTGNLVDNVTGVIVKQNACRNVAVINCFCDELLGAVLQVFFEVDLGKLRSSLINIGNIGLRCTVGKRTPVGHGGGTAVVHIVLRRHG